MIKKKLTLCIIRQGSRILLGMKKRGFGEGRWNGFGGKIQPGETIEEAAKREVTEECGVVVDRLNLVGVLDFEFETMEDILEVHIFHASEFAGMPVETEEMIPRWFNLEDVPYSDMWSDDKYWLPLFLEGKRFKGRCLFDKNDNVIEQEIIVVENL